jgi:hypothetical protein
MTSEWATWKSIAEYGESLKDLERGILIGGVYYIKMRIQIRLEYVKA